MDKDVWPWADDFNVKRVRLGRRVESLVEWMDAKPEILIILQKFELEQQQ